MENAQSASNIRDLFAGELDNGKYTTIMEDALDIVERRMFFWRKTGSENPAWVPAFVLFIFLLLVPAIISVLFGETIGAFAGAYRLRDYFLALLGLGYAFFSAGVIGRGLWGILNLSRILIDYLPNDDDIVVLRDSVAELFEDRKLFIFSLGFGILFGIYFSTLIAGLRGSFFGYGVALFLIIIFTIAGLGPGYMVRFIRFPLRLSNFAIRLFDQDPWSSEIITILSGRFSRFVVITAVLAALGTLALGYLGVLTSEAIVLILALVWVPITGIFITNQYALKTIITKAKWVKINEIQANIRRIEELEKIPTSKTLDHLKRMLDYHNRVRDTRNSTLDLRTVANFITSLLLPLLTYFLSEPEVLFSLFP